MKTFFKLILLTALVVASTTNEIKTINADTNNIVVINDENFKECINTTLAQGSDEDITESQMSSLTSLTCNGNTNSDSLAITDIQGAQYLTNLTHLHLSGNEITDLSALSSLDNLQELDLSYNTISDVSSLGELGSLEILLINDNNISDLSSLSNLTNLQALNFEHNNVSDLSFVSNFTNLYNLRASNNNISDLTPLKDLPNLLALFLSSNNVSDLTPLKSVDTLVRLIINDNSVSDITPLIELKKLRSFFANSQNIQLDDLTVYNSTYTLPPLVSHMTGEMLDYQLKNEYVLEDGENNITNNWEDTKHNFSGTIRKKIVREYSKFNLMANSFESELGTKLTTKKIVELSNAIAIDTDGSDITDKIEVSNIDTIDVNVEGVYQTTLNISSTDGEVKTITIEITIVNTNDTDENDTDENDTDENDTDENDTDENDTDENDTDENDTDENDTDENDTDENDTDENDTDQNDTDQNDTDEDKNILTKTGTQENLLFTIIVLFLLVSTIIFKRRYTK